MDVEPADSSGGGTRPHNRRAARRTALRRARGALLRLAFDRRVAVGVGVVLFAPAALLRRADYGWESWLTDGLGLLCGATGVAFVAFALSGRRPDWIDPDG